MNEERQDQGDKLDALLREAAREYHAPPATPKAELWERIRAVRESEGRRVGKSETKVFRPSYLPTFRRDS